jgi:hypothetical protein
MPRWPSGRYVACIICGVLWDAADPGVSYRSIDHSWWCANFRCCNTRVEHSRQRSLEIAKMFAALDSVWDQLEKDGWKI